MPSEIIQVIAPHQLPIVTGQFIGVIGESHIIGETYGADLRCDFRFQGYADLASLRADQKTLESKIGKLTGTLSQTVNSSTQTFQCSTFLGFAPSAPAFFDGSGVYGWVQFGQLFWRQRRRG